VTRGTATRKSAGRRPERRLLRAAVSAAAAIALAGLVAPAVTADAATAPQLKKLPVVTSLTPDVGSTLGGTAVTVAGTSLAPSGWSIAVAFGSAPGTITASSATAIVVSTPPEAAGSVAVTVTFSKGKKKVVTDQAGTFTFVAPPHVVDVTSSVTGATAPAAGPLAGGNTVKITGTGLAGATSVLFGTVPATVTADTATSVTATAPAVTAPATVDVTVTTVGGTSPTVAADQYTYEAAPVVTSIIPDNGLLAGDTGVTITGSNLSTATAVDFGTQKASSFAVISPTTIDAYSPAAKAVGTVAITVVSPGGTSATSSADAFSYGTNVVPTLPSSATTSDGANGLVATLPCATGTCPTVDVNPVTDLQSGEFITIKTTNFPGTDSFRVALCSAITSATDPSCLGGSWEGQSYFPTTVPVSNDTATSNLTSVNYPLFSDPSGEGNGLLPAEDIENLSNGLNTPGFYCDNAADPCSIVVTDETGQGPDVGFGPAVDPSNSVVIPLTFQAQTTGCPSTDPELQTESSTSLQQFLPAAVEATCGGAHGVVALNTTNDTRTVASDFACSSSSSQGCSPPDVAFLDNPQDPAEAARLKSRGYSLIPVAVSASSVAFLAGTSVDALSVPTATYNLTPNMVAGLISSAYQTPGGSLTFNNGSPVFALSDNLSAKVQAAGYTCARLYSCPASGYLHDAYLANLDAFDLFNPLSSADLTNGGVSPQVFGSFMPDVPDGSSYRITDWLCHAPNPASTATVFTSDSQGDPVATPLKLTDGAVASSTLTVPPDGSSVWPPAGDTKAAWVFPSCSGTSDIPSISGTSAEFSAAQSPALQAKALRGWAYGGGDLPAPPNPGDPLAGFAVMDSSEAAFYGLDTASLQNASGAFVAPTTASVEATLATATPCASGVTGCPVGTYAINDESTNPSAYPVPDITYAVVPTGQLPADKATAIKDLLTNLVTYSKSGSLPNGYYPLPATMATAALSEINSEISPPTTSTTPATAPAATPTPSGTNSGTGPDLPYTTNGSENFSTAPTTVESGTGGTVTRTVTPSTKPLPAPVVPADLATVSVGLLSKYLLPIMLGLALLCLVGGSLLVMANVRRRRSAGPA
jgi:hypothetical protein